MSKEPGNKIVKSHGGGLSVVLATVAIQLTIGIAYIWSVFQTGIAESIFRGDNAKAGLTFSLLLSILTIGSVIGGKLAFKYSTRIVVFIGGIIIGLGFLLASFVTEKNAWLLWITYGGMGGLGMGFTYSTTIACAQKWYPHKKGFVTGIIVSVLGLGGVIFTPIVERLIIFFGGAGAGEFKTFMILGAVFFVVCSVGSVFLKNPPEIAAPASSAGYMATATAQPATPQKAEPKIYTPGEMLKTPQFYLLTFAFLLACMSGLMMIGFAKPIAFAKGLEATATIGVLAITMFNSVGRLVWGMISDKLGRKNTILILLTGSAVFALLVKAATGNWVFVVIACIGFFYGGLLSNFPALTADLFGAKHMATNYGFVLLGFGSGAVISSQIAGHFRNIAVAENDIGLMFPAFIIAAACSVTSIGLILILKVLRNKQKAVNG